ncbi:MAG TPA: hypothetical protein VM943_07725 [Pyrinomonadaceae bacterium]|nr:hypothetical protein [Pyrinomonadaceae bacterium]
MSTLNVSLESPQSGWMSLRLRAGEQSLVMGVSCAPDDSLRDLIKGLTDILEGSCHVRVRWNCEPEQFDFDIATENDMAQLIVTCYPDHRRDSQAGQALFSLHVPKSDLCLPFWRELRGLERRAATDVFEKNWRRPFPRPEMQVFTKRVRQLRREMRKGPPH